MTLVILADLHMHVANCDVQKSHLSKKSNNYMVGHRVRSHWVSWWAKLRIKFDGRNVYTH